MDYSFSNKISELKPSIIREILKATSGKSVIPFSAGNPAPETFPVEAIRRFTQSILEENPVAALQYGITEGYDPLRELLKRRLRDRFGSGRDFDDLFVVSGAQQGLELACKVFCNEGDAIVCESPSFIGALNSFRSLGARLLGVPMENDGLDVAALEHTLATEKNIKLIYLIPSFQNPTGITTSLEKRRAIYALAKQYGVMILEDNPYGDLRFRGEHIPTIKSMDEEGLVIYCGSFSKILSAGLRVGFVLAPSPVMEKMVVAKQGEDVHSVMLSQLLAYKFMGEYDFDGHIGLIREVYRRKCKLMTDSMDRFLDKSITYTCPDGGLFLWCSLPAHMDMLDYCKRAAGKGVAVVPGTAFLVQEGEPCNAIRLNYSTPSDEQIVKGVEILGSL
ncbi:MAG: GntR family transcriptional regulator [Paenibacillaceae bacterium]|jgi:2-aminoadipate transaminase|nr:GntR family transcriptional regulator [Paenibacillaceae bacterium]